MQFVKNGPDIPERLLQAHEEGQVVFFCGAGISGPAKLPTFSRLVRQLYDAIPIDPDPVELSAVKAGQYDRALGLLEARVQGGRQSVRRKLAPILTPSPNVRNATATHEALLTLGRDRQGKTRLITTNFDRLFETVIARTPLEVERFAAPLLPVPKKRWDGLVYLHGLLTEKPSESDLEKLVVSSGDFGLAYLTERWAARFVSELLRNFIVCFVGYGINDPVLRYMMDAIAADRLLGESPPEMFAFGVFRKGRAGDVEKEWRSKNVTPLLYRAHWRHAYLHRTLWAWSEAYRDGVLGKERIVVESAMARPVASTKQDDFVGRVIWALSDPTGLPTRRFAELDPVPSLDWLGPLGELRFGHTDLQRFGISASGAADEKLSFSLTHRPATYGLAPWMALVGSGAEATGWDEVMFRIAQWLTRHLNDPKLLLWIAERGGVLHWRFARQVEAKLDELSGLEERNDQVTLQRIRANAPNAIPDGWMRTLWQLVVKGQVRRPADGVESYRWRKELQRYGLTLALRFDLREKLRPRVVFGERFVWPAKAGGEGTDAPDQMKRLVTAEVVLATREIRHQLQELGGNERWADALPGLLDDFTRLLRDALDLRRELEQVGGRGDLSHLDQPSISEHAQNRGYRDWTALIELVRDAWLATRQRSPEDARRAAETWWRIPYPVFRRFAFFAATHDDIIPCRQAVEWLLSDQARWLWATETRREAMRLLVGLAPRLDVAELDVIEGTILAGPPRTLYGAGIAPEVWARIQDREIWLRLAKLAESGATLSEEGAERRDALSARRRDRRLADDERDEFPVWMDSGSDGFEFVATPREPEQLIEWLKVNGDNERWPDDDWSERCRKEFGATSAALAKLATQAIWPRRCWNRALLAWREKELSERSWTEMAAVIAGAPDEALQALRHGVSGWLRALGKSFNGQNPTFLALCDRLLDLKYEEDERVDDLVFQAINHPVGHATDALIDWWYRRGLRDDQGLDEDVRFRFSKICDARVGKLRHGRVVLAKHVVALFRVDPDWTRRFLLPLFRWNDSANEARGVWTGFLLSPRLYFPLMEELKCAFLDTAKHYDELGRQRDRYSSVLTFTGLNLQSVFTRSELRKATAALPQEGLHNAAATLVRALKAAGGQRAEYWKNRVLPYLRDVWPKTQDIASASVAENFALLCVAVGEKFPAALEELESWLQPVGDPERVLQDLHEMKLQELFPEETLRLLDGIFGTAPLWLSEKVKECLQAIRAKRPKLDTDYRFRRLEELVKRWGP